MFVKKPRVRRGSNHGASVSLLSSTYGSHRLHPFFLKWEEKVVEGGTQKSESVSLFLNLLDLTSANAVLLNLFMRCLSCSSAQQLGRKKWGLNTRSLPEVRFS